MNSAPCKKNVIQFDYYHSEKEMRWIWTFMIGFSLLFLTSMILPPWDRWAPFRSLYKGSSVELDQNCSTNVFSFNLEHCPSCSRSIQQTTCRWPFPDLTFDTPTHFLQTSSSSKLFNLLCRLLATRLWSTCGCLCLLWRPETSAPRHHLL